MTLALGLWVIADVAEAAVIHVLEITHEHGEYRVDFVVRVQAPARSVYRVLTDYDRLERLSTVITAATLEASSGPHRHRVSSVLEACVAWVCRTMTQVQAVTERPPRSVDAEILPGPSDFERGHSRWRILELDGGSTRLVYHATVVPDFWVPPVIGPWLIERTFRRELVDAARRLEELAAPSPP
ncbi:MAG: hypothetical protein GWO02_18425 [Gammaproteobacteria bacterium]|nr:hypothetical protein [Gammaproteobacteria bacterium]